MHTGRGVRLTLERGRSNKKALELEGDHSVRHLVVGSSSRCDWRVCAPGVRARHLRLVFCRGRLRIEEHCSGSEVRVEGRRLEARLDLVAGAELELGGAVIRVEPLEGR